ncbi:MAG: hypothetical protein J6T34_03550 [Bacilli bacterium]|nr:hypothetical protein [Bacilli bacterium]
MAYLLKTVETYRVSDETEAKKIIEDAKNDRKFTLSKYLSEKKDRKAKGEIIDEWIRVTLTKNFNDEKEPCSYVDIAYNVEQGFFPSPITKEEEEDED